MPKNALDQFGGEWSSTMHTMPLLHAYRELHAFTALDDDGRAAARLSSWVSREQWALKTGHSFPQFASSLLPVHQPLVRHCFGLVGGRTGSIGSNSCDEDLQLAEQEVGPSLERT